MPLSMVEREAKDAAVAQSVVLSGVYAWAATVLYPATLRGAGTASRITTVLALVCLLAGAIVGRRYPRLGPWLSLHGFVGASVLSWLLFGSLLAPDRLDPARAALGALGWALFALAWGAPQRRRHIPEDDPRFVPGEPLPPRHELPPHASPLLAVVTVFAAGPLVLAFRVTRTYHALFAHAVAVASAVALVTVGADIAIRRGRWAPVEPVGRRFEHALVPLGLLGILLVVGAVALFSG